MSLFWVPDHPYSSSSASDYAAASAARAQASASEARESVRDTDERLDQLLLVCAAMWELLSEKAGVAEADLVAKVAEIDARDGTADGRFTYAPTKCVKCQRTMFPKHRRCLYCGADRAIDTVFKTI